MAPDKIYVTIDRPKEKVEFNPELVGVAWTEKDSSCDHIEYIRKDALLEWLESVKHVYELPINGRDASKICSSKADAFQMVIDKLNSM